MSADASHMTEPDPTGESPARAMTMALADAGIDPTEVGYVNAHATSTPLGDAAETKVIKIALGEEHARRLAGLLDEGRDRATASAPPGAIEAVFTMLALRDRIVPADDQLRRARPRLRPRLRPERVARGAGAARRGVELVRLRRPQRDDRPARARGLAGTGEQRVTARIRRAWPAQALSSETTRTVRPCASSTWAAV